MRETLYIRLGDTPFAPVEYGATAADPRTLSVLHGSLDEALALAPGKRLIVFVPASEVRLSRVSVPARQPSKVLQAVPYALEDQVAEDVDSLHFAVGPRQADETFPVAIVSRQRMDAWTEPFLARGLRPDGLLPEHLALPVSTEPLAWSAVADAAQVIVRNGPWSGFSCAVEDLPTYLDLAAAGGEKPPLRLLLPADSTTDWSVLDWPLELLPGFAAPLVALATHYKPDASINLLQGGYALSRDLQRLWTPWRAAAVLGLVWAVVAGAGFGLDHYRLGKELARQDEANLQRFQQLFPAETRIVDLSAQLDQQVRALSSGSGGGLFTLLDALSQGLAANPGIKLIGLQYREGALFLSMSGKDLQALESLRNSFASNASARLEVQSANAESGAVQIRAKLSPA